MLPTLRPASKAGTWYSDFPEVLRQNLDRHLKNAPVDFPATTLVAGIVPHAGLAYSGDTAGALYGVLAAEVARGGEDIDTFLIFGAVHTGRLTCPAIWTHGEWDTPLGALAIDEELAAALLAEGVGEANPSPHLGDNAIELQTPFIKHLFPRAKLLPVATPPLVGSEEIGRKAFCAVRNCGRRVLVLGSTDLTHYGKSFGFTPAGFGAEALAWGRANDREFLSRAQAMESAVLVPLAREAHSACGAGAAAAAIAYAEAAGCSGGRILAQTTSAEVTGEVQPEHFVGYGAVGFFAED